MNQVVLFFKLEFRRQELLRGAAMVDSGVIQGLYRQLLRLLLEVLNEPSAELEMFATKTVKGLGLCSLMGSKEVQFAVFTFSLQLCHDVVDCGKG